MRWRLAVMTTALALIAAACADPPRDPAPSRPTSSNTTAAAEAEVVASGLDAEATAPAAPIPRARKGGTLTVYASGVPRTFDPTASYFTDSSAILTLVTRGLTQYRYDPEAKMMVLVPDLATDLGRPNADHTRWTFTLRDGLRYEDGTPVTAGDVGHAIRRQFARTELPGGPTYGVDYFVDGDTYRGPFRDGDDFAGVETPDDKTIIIKMRRPFADLPHYASFPNFTAIPAEQDTGKPIERPVATGPYRFAAYDPGRRLVLERNPHWDPETDPARHQYVDRFVFRFGQDARKAQQTVIEDRGVDQRAIVVDDILAETWRQLDGTEGEQRIAKSRSTCTDLAFMDTRKIPLEVRRAIQVAWPVTAEARAEGRIPGLTWSPSTSIMPSITPGWISYDSVGNDGLGNGDPDRARQLLEDAGHLPFQLAMPNVVDDPIKRAVAQVRREALEKAGFEVDLVEVAQDDLRAFIEDADAPIDIRFLGWCTDWPSGSAVFPALFDGRKIAPGSVAANPTLLNEPEINAEIDRISALPPEVGVHEWGELDRLIMEKYAPVVLRGETDVAMLHGSKVRNVVIDPALSMPHYAGMYVVP